MERKRTRTRRRGRRTRKRRRQQKKREKGASGNSSITSGAIAQITVKPQINPDVHAVTVPSPEPESSNDSLATGYYGMLLDSKRVELLCRSLALRPRDITRVRARSDQEDLYQSGYMTRAEFFHILGEDGATTRLLTMGIFAFVGLPAAIQRLTFDQFVLCVVTFASLSRTELLRYAFDLFDEDGSGSLSVSELHALCGTLKNDDFFFPANRALARQRLAHPQDPDALVDFQDLVKACAQFPVAFFPILQLQRNMQGVALGERFWRGVVCHKEQVTHLLSFMRTHAGHLPPLSMACHAQAWVSFAVFQVTQGQLGRHGAFVVRPAAVIAYAAEQYAKQQLELQQQQERAPEGHEDAAALAVPMLS